MTQRREPLTFEDAITRILGFLSADRAAEVVSKSTSMVRQWSDPDVDALPNLKQAAALDAACAAETGEMPIGSVYAAVALRLAGGARNHTPGCPIDRLAELARETAEAIDAYRAQHKFPSPVQRSEAKRELAEMIDAAERAIADIEAQEAEQARPQAVA